MIEDCELLRHFAEGGDQTAFATLVARKVNLVYSAALRQTGGDGQLAQEVTQAVFLDLASKAKSLARHTSLAGWLLTSTRFAAAKAVRTQQRWQHRNREAQAMHEIEQSHRSVEPAWNQLRPVLDAALAELGERDREALLLRFFEERPLSEVGSRIGLSENSARMCVDRALEKLRRTLARHGVTSTASALGIALTQHAVTAAPAGLAAVAAESALAGVASTVLTTSTAGAKFFHVMTMTKFHAGAAGLIGLAAVTALVFERQENAELRTEAAAVRQETAELQRENDRLTALAAASQPSERKPPTLTAATGMGLQEPTFGVSPAGAAHTVELEVNEKEIEHLMDIQRKGQLEARYAALLRLLNLSPEKADQFKKLLFDRQNTLRDVLAAGREQGLGMEELHANLPAMVEKTNAVLDANIRALLGEESYQQYQNYQSTLPQRAVAEQLAARLNSTADPLSSRQLEELVQILAANSPPAAADPVALEVAGDQVFIGNVESQVFVGNVETGPEFGGPVFAVAGAGSGSNASPLTDSAIAGSGNVLSSPQLKVLQQIQAEQQAARTMSQRLMINFPRQTDSSVEIAVPTRK